MRRSFSLPAAWSLRAARIKDPRVGMRAVLGALVAANLVAAVVAFRPFGGSPEDLARREQSLGTQLLQAQKRLAQTKALVAKVHRARQTGDDFLDRFTTDRQTTFSTIYAELDRAAKDAGIQPKPLSINLEPVEGSDSLMQMTITAGYEGNYQNLAKFVNLLDRSPRFLIIESMTASPQTSGNALNVSFKLDTFVREQPGGKS